MNPQSPTNQLTANSSPESSQLVETYAEELMDDLFNDVDRILEGDLTAEPSTAVPFAASTEMPFTPTATSAMIVPVRATESVEASASALPSEAELASAPEPAEQPVPRRWYAQRWPLLVAGAVGVSIIAVLGYWLAKEQSRQSAAVLSAESAAAPVSEEVAFLEYLGRSLSLIDGKTAAQSSAAVAPAGPGLPAVPVSQVAGAGSGPRVPSVSNIIERVFVPVFQPAQTQPAQTQPAQPQSTAALPSLPAAPVAAPTVPTTPAAPAPAAAALPSISPMNTHVLVGVLELGERSAALFDINGVSQRVYVGENIGASGWTVVSIANEEIVVRRNGEVRSIYIGQQF
ncbi:MAG: hypothetical protein F6J97_22850 [Leptolyngbya sp. SIO4C1]|nr:hypothetical protein [Leptolyngbya sp. SIO4C1]